MRDPLLKVMISDHEEQSLRPLVSASLRAQPRGFGKGLFTKNGLGGSIPGSGPGVHLEAQPSLCAEMKIESGVSCCQGLVLTD